MSSTSSAMPSPSSAAPSPAATTAPPAQQGGSGGGPTSSPLLFFVALGFGVVFTNLWIIVGVKYCFRYNQRNRRAQQDENGEPIDMTAMPRTHRRRREKKLMSMDEVNERFPLMKYKAWMTTRAEEGLPTAGGVVVPSESRAASMRNVEGVISARRSGDLQRPVTPATKESMEEKKDSPEPKQAGDHDNPSSLDNQHPTDRNASQDLGDASAQLPKVEPTATSTSNERHEEDLDDDDQIQMAVPTEMMDNPGDSCAICLDTLESDDDVRGLTCGHAFHASCLDPWLTSRRACCPLCKADYYVPKPRPEGEAPADTDRLGRRPAGPQIMSPNIRQFGFMSGRPASLLPGRLVHLRRNERNAVNAHGSSLAQRNGQQTRFPRNQNSNDPDRGALSGSEAQPRNTWRSRFSGFTPSAPRWPGHSRRANDASQSTNVAEEGAGHNTAIDTTPSQLEAGQRQTVSA